MSENFKPKAVKVFVVVWLGQLFSLIGSSLTGFALGIWVYQSTGSVTQFALIFFCTVMPGVLLSPLAGALVDRWNYRYTMLISDSGAALGTLAIAGLFFSGQLEIWHIYTVTAINSAFSAFQWPAYAASMTLLVPKQQLGRANGMTQMGRATAQLIAPLLGAILLNAIGLLGIIMIDFISFLIALLSLLSIRIPNPIRSTLNQAKQTSLLREIIYGWTYVAARPGILGLLLFFTATNFLGGTIEVLVTPLVLSFASTVELGMIMSIGGIGMLAGSIFMSIWGGPKCQIRAVFGFMLLCGVSTVIVGVQASVLLISVAAFVLFFGLPIINGSSQVILQKKVAPEVQGRVFALEGALGSVSLPLAYLLAGPLVDYIFAPLMIVDGPLADSLGFIIGTGPGRGIGLMFVVFGLLTIVFTIIAYRYPRLRFVEEELPDSMPDDELVTEQSEVINEPVMCQRYSG